MQLCRHLPLMPQVSPETSGLYHSPGQPYHIYPREAKYFAFLEPGDLKGKDSRNRLGQPGTSPNQCLAKPDAPIIIKHASRGTAFDHQARQTSAPEETCTTNPRLPLPANRSPSACSTRSFMWPSSSW